MDLRRLPPECPLAELIVTLARLRDGRIEFTHRAGEKRDWMLSAVEEMRAGTVYFAGWTGQWHTDLFLVTEADVLRFLDEERRREGERGRERVARRKAKRVRRG